MSILNQLGRATGIIDDPTAPIALLMAAPAPTTAPPDGVMAIIDAVFDHFAENTKRFPTLHGAIEGFHALADALLPSIAAKLPSGDVKTIVAALLAQLLPLTLGIPILHGFLLVAQMLLNLWVPAVSAKLAAKSVAA